MTRCVLESSIGRRLSDRFNVELPPLRPETRARLAAELAGPTRALGVFLGRDLSAWLR
jgi:hypothetical protein